MEESLKGLYIRSSQTDTPWFIIESNHRFIRCMGVSPNLTPKTPLVVTGSFDQTRGDLFNVNTLEINSGDRAAMISFLAGRSFPHVGKASAGHIIDALHVEASKQNLSDYTQLDHQTIVQTLTLLTQTKSTIKLEPEVIDKIALVLSSMQCRIDVYHNILKFQGTYNDAEKLYNRYNNAAWQEFCSDPYGGIECGLSFDLCDRVAFALGMDPFCQERILAFGTELTEYIKQGGSCCITLKAAASILDRLQTKSAYPPMSSWTILSDLTSTSAFILEDIEEYGPVIYPIHLYRIEEGIAQELLRLKYTSEKTGYTQYTGTWTPDHDQLQAINMVAETGGKVITGGPGTGKTTVIKEIIREFKQACPHDAIFLCAPTGAAAVRITQSIQGQYHATTIHKLLDVRTFGNDQFFFSYNKKHQLPKGLFIVDEMSMVGEILFYSLLQAIPDGSMVILSGDIDQLQSVSAGTVLKDVISSNALPVVRLTTIHRQDNDSTIAANYFKIRNGDINLGTDEHFIIERCNNDTQMLQTIAYHYHRFNGQCQILSNTRKGRIGKEYIDFLITSAYNDSRVQYKNSGFYLGDKIMMIVNNYNRGYWNGDTGIITEIKDHCIYAQFYDGLRELNDEDLLNAEHAWCCTVHKAQGNEYDNVIVILDDEFSNMLYRSIILTAVTRAKNNIVIVTKNFALETGIRSQTEELRITGLSAIIKEKDAFYAKSRRDFIA